MEAFFVKSNNVEEGNDVFVKTMWKTTIFNTINVEALRTSEENYIFLIEITTIDKFWKCKLSYEEIVDLSLNTDQSVKEFLEYTLNCFQGEDIKSQGKEEYFKTFVNFSINQILPSELEWGYIFEDSRFVLGHIEVESEDTVENKQNLTSWIDAFITEHKLLKASLFIAIYIYPFVPEKVKKLEVSLDKCEVKKNEVLKTFQKSVEEKGNEEELIFLKFKEVLNLKKMKIKELQFALKYSNGYVIKIINHFLIKHFTEKEVKIENDSKYLKRKREHSPKIKYETNDNALGLDYQSNAKIDDARMLANKGDSFSNTIEHDSENKINHTEIPDEPNIDTPQSGRLKRSESPPRFLSNQKLLIPQRKRKFRRITIQEANDPNEANNGSIKLRMANFLSTGIGSIKHVNFIFDFFQKHSREGVMITSANHTRKRSVPIDRNVEDDQYEVRERDRERAMRVTFAQSSSTTSAYVSKYHTKRVALSDIDNKIVNKEEKNLSTRLLVKKKEEQQKKNLRILSLKNRNSSVSQSNIINKATCTKLQENNFNAHCKTSYKSVNNENMMPVEKNEVVPMKIDQRGFQNTTIIKKASNETSAPLNESLVAQVITNKKTFVAQVNAKKKNFIDVTANSRKQPDTTKAIRYKSPSKYGNTYKSIKPKQYKNALTPPLTEKEENTLVDLNNEYSMMDNDVTVVENRCINSKIALKKGETFLEYSDEIFSYWKELELERIPDANYMMLHPELKWEMRRILVGWLAKIHKFCNFEPDTLFLSVNIVDRVMSYQGKGRAAVGLSKYQLVGIVSFLIAAKYEEIKVPSMRELLFLVENVYTEHEILFTERWILKILNFEVGFVSPLNFLCKFSQIDNNDLAVLTLSKYILEVALVDEGFVSVCSSLISASSFYLAHRILQKNWSADHLLATGYCQLKLDITSSGLFQIFLNNNQRDHHFVIFEKYALEEYHGASVYVQEIIEKIKVCT
ncbi:hypothetical protein HDU92_005726 [Lobulomyces angularis]|nr:hypothetical protein HDU92_005726 [Lobulomyces angularis]